MEEIIDLNELELNAVIECPYCHKGKIYAYGAKGKGSGNCFVCKRLILWDFDRLKAYKASAKKYVKTL